MARREPRCFAGADGFGRPQERFGRLTRKGLVGLMIVSLVLAVGCADIRVRAGGRPDTDILERSLRLGESTRTDVVAVLGQPYGKGRSMLPTDPKPRAMWSYYYEEGTIRLFGTSNDARRVFLFIYFDQDRYDGYMWFSSLRK